MHCPNADFPNAAKTPANQPNSLTGKTTILLLLRSQLYLWGSPFFFFFFFFCVPSYISGVHHSSSSSSSAFQAISPGFTILLLPLRLLLLPLLLRSQLYLMGSPFLLFFFFFICVPSYISGVHHSYSSSSAFPAISLGFTILLLLLLRSQLNLWGSPFFFFVVCVPSYISEIHHSSSSSFSSSSSAFPAISLGSTILLLLRSQTYLWGSPLHSSSSSAFPAISLGFTILGEIFAYVTVFYSKHRGSHIPSSWMVHDGWDFFFFWGGGVVCLFFFGGGGLVFLLLLLPAFTCLGHERQDLWSPCDGTHMCTD